MNIRPISSQHWLKNKPMQINALLRQATQQLLNSPGGSDSARLDAELLLAHCLDKPRSYLFTWPEAELTTEQLTCFNRLLAQRHTGQPIAYLLGYREFWDLVLSVTPATLIPRPETELLVETALTVLPDDTAPDNTTVHILELGTGSGAIALVLAKTCPSAHIIAGDISAAALAVAQVNAEKYQLNNIDFLQSDWFSNIPANNQFDLVISNPPYIAMNDPHLSLGDVRFEPPNALASGADGLEAIRHLITHAPRYLKPTGILMFEHGFDQGGETIGLMQQAGFRKVRCIKDMAGHDRVTLGHAPVC